MLTPVERVFKTIQLEATDIVPVDLHAFAMAAENSPYSMAEIFKSGELIAKTQMTFWKKFKHDMILLENGTTALAEAMGAQVVYPENEVPKVIKPVLDRLEDVEKLSVPDPGSAATLPELLRATEIMVKEIGNEAFIMGRADQGPFSLAALLRGVDNFLMDLLAPEKRELLDRLLEICTLATTKFALAQLEAGAHATSMGESLAGPDLISPKMYEEFAQPYEKRVVDAVKEKNGIISLHICGNSTGIIDLMVQTGAQILEIDEKVDLKVVKEAVKGKACLLGPVSPRVLRFGTAVEIEILTKKAMEIAGADGGLILGPGCALAPGTPEENITAMITTAREYGIS
ncbi:MAG: hypothetical protein APF76_14910 [Desulfitibacter sp. BRH_c19]|nr:MAG: hypothetical protein APF76_14910 [Desulfitibacter sp. BRH_c19]